MKAFSVLLLLAGCSKTAAPPPDAAPPAPVIEAAAPPASVDPLAIVLDGKSGTLPERSTDFGKELDPALRDKIAPPRTGPVRQGPITVDHGLPPEVVKRIVRQNFGRFRICYQKATATLPELAGTMTIAFTIDRTGAPIRAERNGGTLESAPLSACVVAVFGQLSFPAPEPSGESHVIYGLEFEPD